MSKWTWIEALSAPEVEAQLTQTAEQQDRLRLELLTIAEQRKQLEFRMNRLRREAGEIK